VDRALSGFSHSPTDGAALDEIPFARPANSGQRSMNRDRVMGALRGAALSGLPGATRAAIRSASSSRPNPELFRDSSAAAAYTRQSNASFRSDADLRHSRIARPLLYFVKGFSAVISANQAASRPSGMWT